MQLCSCVADVMERAGRIHVLVNNAAAGLIGAIEETPAEDAMTLFDTTTRGRQPGIGAGVRPTTGSTAGGGAVLLAEPVRLQGSDICGVSGAAAAAGMVQP
jgi:NAD(P)-dependent dehydrogenase (short-subunit alcohol dehydrogenase family)